MAADAVPGSPSSPGCASAWSQDAPTRAEVDDLPGATMVEFGTPGCGHCRAAQPMIAAALRGHDDVRHLKIEDGSGRPLGRSFGVKLWPTLVFLRGGREVARLVRPRDAAGIDEALAALGSEAGPP